MDAATLLGALEDGTVDLQTPVKLSDDASSKPLRRYLRELVWMSFMNAQTVHKETRDAIGPFRMAFEKSYAGIAIADLSGRIQRVNASFAKLLGRDATDLEGELVSNISQPDDHKREVKLGNEMFAGQRLGFQIQKRFEHSNGQWVPTLMNLGLVRDDAGKPRMVVASVIDLREQLQAERQRALEAENAAVQRIARGAAHDFNNLLQVMRLSVGFLREQPTLQQDEDLLAIGQATDAAIRLTGQLRDLSRIGGAADSQCDLANELRNREVLVTHLVKDGQRITVTVPDGVIAARIDSLAVEQLLLNLVVNASQATPSDGQIDVKLVDYGEVAELSVTDSGSGMTPQVQKRALEPFFTARNGGTGLGLAIVNAAVTRCGCTLSIESEVGAGTCIRIKIPRAALS